jgi:glycosyltransferase involved in cell wall biosynthesis
LAGGGDVLYVSGCPGGSHLYRCVNQSESAGLLGLKTTIVSQDNPYLLAMTKKFSVFVFQRVVVNESIQEVLTSIAKAGKRVVFETDDLVFDPAYLSQMDYYRFMGEEERGWYENGIGREILEKNFVTNCLVSTDFLAEVMRSKYPDKKVLVAYNTLGTAQVKLAEETLVRKEKLRSDDGRIRIGYFSGSRSHNKDFDVVAPVLLALLQRDKRVVLRVVGHLDIGQEFEIVKNQIEVISFVSLRKLSELIATVDINIVPLETENSFCLAKSAIKYMEAGVLGVPTIASATPDFARCICDGENGLLAHNMSEWETKLAQCIDDKVLRERLGEAARANVLAYHTTRSKDALNNEVRALFGGSKYLRV